MTARLRWFLALLLPVSASAPLHSQPAPTESEPATASSAREDMTALVTRITQKLREGVRSPEGLGTEIAEFDALVSKYRETDAEGAAQILLMKAMLYLQVFGDMDEGVAHIDRIAADFGQTEAAQMVPQLKSQIEQVQQTERAKQAVVGKAAPELNFRWASQEGLNALSDLKGKVVVLDFWATWCGPCVATFPEIKALRDHYEGFPVEIIGVTSLQGRVHGLEPQPIDCRNDPEKEIGLMPRYMEAKNINWVVAFSQQEVFNPDYGVTGIPHMAIIGPDGIVRHNGIHVAMPLEEKTRLIDALLRDAGLSAPKA